MIRTSGRHFPAVAFLAVTAIFATPALVSPSSTSKVHGDEPAKEAKSPPAKQTEGQGVIDEETRSFEPVATEPETPLGDRTPVERRPVGESPFLSDSYQRQIALWVLLGFAVIVLLNLVVWRNSPETEAIETPPVEAPSYDQVLAAAAERERIKQMTQHR